MNLRKIAIIGMGLMGGSLAAAAKRHFPNAFLTGVSRNRAALGLARKKMWVHETTTNLAKGVAGADLIVVCTPVDCLSRMLKLIDPSAKDGALVTDVGSVKQTILRRISGRKWKHIRFVSAHPMVGSHERGMESATPWLYDQGYTFLIRPEPKDAGAYAAVKGFWKKISPRVIEMSAREHDKLVGEISHLPHLLAVCLVLGTQKKFLKFAAAGYRDVTRVAEGHPSIWFPIFQANRKEILNSLARFEQQIRAFRKAYGASHSRKLVRLLEEARRKRQEI
ncbi:MAG: prephenate dehydrogenase/arogenate dehydrogenase family protein [Candidatus Omnitrophica bacterium]|nr:prephenate dehydrogenase/arogenate dehydrogenase family protein [Candidatus Omnitrophota bacterium]MDD5670569.1 prephenate dehydrogenase/arogenate dehydrogenase family protein [Candidatus Omnitrophota bacterium]